MMTAMLARENISANTKLYDLWQVNQDAEYHEAGDAPAEQTVGTAIRLVPTRVTATPELAPGRLIILRPCRDHTFFGTEPTRVGKLRKNC